MINLKPIQFSRAIAFFDLFSNQMSAQELNDGIQNHSDRFLLVDVRTQEEYEQDHLPQAILLPLTDIEQGRGIEQLQLASQARQLVVYCTVGKRSQKALHLLQTAGLSGLNLKGGIRAWHRSVQLAQAKV